VTGANDHYRVAIVGSGFGGLGAAVKLRLAGIEDFVVLERSDAIGGTWHLNTYPGCQCDIPSHLYSFSFAPNPDWSRTYSRQPEIWAYLQDVSRRYGIDPHVRLRHEMTTAGWDDVEGRWQIEVRVDGKPRELTADLLIACPGQLDVFRLPDIEGIDSFAGTVFHSAEWNHKHSLRGERVGVIGTGASAIQFVPHIQPEVARLHVFQRSAPWILPHSDRPTTRAEHLLYRAIPPVQRLVRGAVYASRELVVPTLMHPHRGSIAERIARRHLRAQVPDPVLRAKLTPRYLIGCKRTLISNDWYPALQQPGVELVTDAIARIEPGGIVTADGRTRELDTIVLGTGFHVAEMPVGKWLRGRDGRTLAEVWQGSPQAYLGTTVSGFPNLFLMYGPNTNLGHNSIVFMIESQLNYVMDCIAHLDRSGMASFEVRADAQERYNVELQRRLQGSVWSTGGCSNWYLDEHGRNSTIWPGSTWPYRRRTRRFDPGSYVLSPRTHERIEFALA
jgi:cation diffusion facilitator CzcD-associated flavoprotein CzcO